MTPPRHTQSAVTACFVAFDDAAVHRHCAGVSDTSTVCPTAVSCRIVTDITVIHVNTGHLSPGVVANGQDVAALKQDHLGITADGIGGTGHTL